MSKSSSKAAYAVAGLTSLIALYEHFIVLARMHKKMNKTDTEQTRAIIESRASEAKKVAQIREMEKKAAEREETLETLRRDLEAKSELVLETEQARIGAREELAAAQAARDLAQIERRKAKVIRDLAEAQLRFNRDELKRITDIQTQQEMGNSTFDVSDLPRASKENQGEPGYLTYLQSIVHNLVPKTSQQTSSADAYIASIGAN